ncbi:cas scaffolding protein family member 4 [Periophthalmus magnuspinnatus]|uniref:cas scaffolding protein family member 4 n=1 Tax=Periophthalmus magnuspinnatus TaxID=409849 RepID=UPI0024369C06|nr:cas scaffolding protein family member 4 [Periophthalmus magnuspinnatus]
MCVSSVKDLNFKFVSATANMMTLAKALYDNTAECSDELAFRKGDILMVMEKNVEDTSGWWMCSLYGRQGLVPANRLCLLSQTTGCPTATLRPLQDKTPPSNHQNTLHNIYQIPTAPKPSNGERTEILYKVPTIPLSVSPKLSTSKQTSDEQQGNKPFNMAALPRGELYDVPNQGRRASLFPASTTPRFSYRKHSLVPISEMHKRSDSPLGFEYERSKHSCIYDVPPKSPQDPNYDIPIPSGTDTQKATISGYSTMPILKKSEWIYDVPVSPDRKSPPPTFTPPRPMGEEQLYDTIPKRKDPVQNCQKSPLLYNVPKSRLLDSPPTLLPRIPVPSKQLNIGQESVYDLPSDDHIPLECRVEPPEATKVPLYRRKTCSSLHNGSDHHASMLLDENDQNQRISTASSSSSSSCDSLALSSPSPEPLREVLLWQEEVCPRFLELQDRVCKAVAQIMNFVSSGWRSKNHMEKHLEEIREAAIEVASSLNGFLNYALDIKGNARRLTDANLQARLYKQLCVVEDSGVVLQQTLSALNAAGWTLDLLSQEAGQAQTADQLERFVMVARTIPEDVKRLVSMINANGKLLFKPLPKESELFHSGASSPPKAPETRDQDVNEGEDDYVELQTKTDFENQQKEVKKDPMENVTVASNNVLNDKNPPLSEAPVEAEEQRPVSLSEHCRLYFGALQKAIGGFVCSLQDGQPPEKFISRSKLVIMVGQRLVNTLYKEAQPGESRQSLLCKSNHLCALLKQLAVATKKAALHFPDRQAVHEAQEFAQELAQRAQHFRLSLNL